ncbi:hypothetical protein CDD80_666 [Ophiocordyceps camponoti-rufipedis]|uniref:Uncharacterized protein n=1 Tax=Ophiocordyceps camponoti-rufipedis TaxID=2004952 RepID=A0A2C5XNV4_9HYPO|nr:hypothetical protein CDD80_666 [Ophiocordyceps camponoti-rufipedis]
MDDGGRPQSPRSPVSASSPPNGPDPEPSARHHGSGLDLNDYFTGPRDMARHSRWPLLLRLHGSILPKLILPVILISIWSATITIVSIKVHPLGVHSVLLTLTGFVVSLSLSFRCSTAYERYSEGRKYWTGLVQASHVLGRVFWIHAKDGPDMDPREGLLLRLTSMNLVVAFALSLKHGLRFEPYLYPDMATLVDHLNTWASAATTTTTTADDPSGSRLRRRRFFHSVGEYLGLSFTASNPRKALKRATQPLGHLPLEILGHLAIAIDALVADQQLTVPAHQTLAYNALQSLNDVMTGTERVLCTPLPIAYSIAISQATYLYLALLPFQLIPLLHWIAIPATIAASCIILSLLFIGQEIEDPFGHDVNDLPLDSYCDQIAADLDVIASIDTREPRAFLTSRRNRPLHPVSTAPYDVWLQRDEERLREAVRQKPAARFEWARWGKSNGSKVSTGSGSIASNNNSSSSEKQG